MSTRGLVAASLLLAFARPALADDGMEMPAYGAMGSAHRFDGLGDHRRDVTTDDPDARAWFDQGLIWLYAFNHDEAVRSFTEAARRHLCR